MNRRIHPPSPGCSVPWHGEEWCSWLRRVPPRLDPSAADCPVPRPWNRGKLHIHLAKSAGFCFGVRRAIKMARALAQTKERVYMLGDLVHNETVIREMEAAGIRKIQKLGIGRNRTLLIRAHGVSKATIAGARRRGYTVVDATCPMVHEIHRIVRRMDRRGNRIIIIGDRRHEEVLGIAGQIRRKAVVIDSLHRIPWNVIRRMSKAAVVIQSTQNLDRVMPIVNALKAVIPQVVFFNTICKPTRMKQEEIKRMPLQNDVMMIIGSRSSANTRRLYEISRSLNPRSYWIQSAAEINARWLRTAKNIGITAGASTPDSITRAVIARIRQMTISK